MTREIPAPLRAAAGLAAAAVEEARRLPSRLAGLPVAAVGAALQASMRVQQRYADLVGRGDQVLSGLREPDEQPPWARFDEDEASPNGQTAAYRPDGGGWAFADEEIGALAEDADEYDEYSMAEAAAGEPPEPERAGSPPPDVAGTGRATEPRTGPPGAPRGGPQGDQPGTPATFRGEAGRATVERVGEPGAPAVGGSAAAEAAEPGAPDRGSDTAAPDRPAAGPDAGGSTGDTSPATRRSAVGVDTAKLNMSPGTATGRRAAAGTGTPATGRSRARTSKAGTSAGPASTGRSKAGTGTATSGRSRARAGTAAAGGSARRSSRPGGPVPDNLVADASEAGALVAAGDATQHAPDASAPGPADPTGATGGKGAAGPVAPGALPLANYDRLTLAQVRARLTRLSADELTAVLEYERANAGRPPYLTMLENRLNRTHKR